ncbi:MAG TPA: hypothetical protein VGI19_18630 [Candidatus Cybelea sp.]|jgi:transcriptional regulator with XRE-family HTH domain
MTNFQPGDVARRRQEAESAHTILERTRVLRGKSVEAIAKETGLSANRLDSLERQVGSPPTSDERTKLRKVYGSSPVLFEEATPDNVAAENSRF